MDGSDLEIFTIQSRAGDIKAMVSMGHMIAYRWDTTNDEHYFTLAKIWFKKQWGTAIKMRLGH